MLFDEKENRDDPDIFEKAQEDPGASALEVTDYTDPVCPFDASMWTGMPQETVPVMRVVEKSEEYLSRDDFKGAEKHLLYWLDSAKAFRDIRGAFFVLNELVGFYRKSGNEKRAREVIAEAFSLTEDERIGKDSTGAATLFVNAATAYKSFDKSEEALPLFKKAQEIYERDLKPGEWKLGGLYNNMALSYADLGLYDEAEAYFFKAIEQMKQVKNGELEQAVTYLNLADIQYEDDPKIAEYLDLAERFLNTETLPRDSYYAYMVDKCAPVFESYGRTAFAEELMRRKEAII
ncbi:MAG: tetratricopeptide repeat protein [Lachnospiraceae bacterium]|nr:tetratricopeptide repeat protein [Lachnospiraceae bacterium]